MHPARTSEGRSSAADDSRTSRLSASTGLRRARSRSRPVTIAVSAERHDRQADRRVGIPRPCRPPARAPGSSALNWAAVHKPLTTARRRSPSPSPPMGRLPLADHAAVRLSCTRHGGTSGHRHRRLTTTGWRHWNSCHGRIWGVIDRNTMAARRTAALSIRGLRTLHRRPAIGVHPPFGDMVASSLGSRPTGAEIRHLRQLVRASPTTTSALTAVGCHVIRHRRG